MIQRFNSLSHYEWDDGQYVKYADHVTREAEQMRLLQAYYRQHQNLAQGYGSKKCSCSTCGAVDALEGKVGA